MEDVKVVTFGEGKIISNWGTYEGHPAVFLEPVSGEPGEVGALVPEGFKGDKQGNVKAGGVILQFKNQAGLDVLKQDIDNAISAKWSVA